jgi:hypothetical protein
MLTLSVHRMAKAADFPIFKSPKFGTLIIGLAEKKGR